MCVFASLYYYKLRVGMELHMNFPCLCYTTQRPSSKCVVTCKVLNFWKDSLINVVSKLTSHRDNDYAII